MTPELKELIRVLKVHPDVLKATIETKDGETFEVKYSPEGGDERVCYRVEEL